MLLDDKNEIMFSAEAGFAQQNNKAHARDITRTVLANVRDRGMDPGRTSPYAYDRMYYTEDGQPFEKLRMMSDGERHVIDAETKELRIVLKKGEHQNKVKSHKVALVPGLPERVETLKRIFKMAKIMGFHQIVDVLNQEGVPGPRGGKWSASSLRAILLNPAYTGTIAYNRRSKSRYYCIRDGKPQEYSYVESGKLNTSRNPKDEWVIIEDAHDALISPEEFQEVQEAIRLRDKGGIKTVRSRVRFYPLSGIARCKRCDAPLQGHSLKSGKSTKRYSYYTCSTSRKHGKSACARYSLPAEALEEFALDRIRAYLLSDEAFSKLQMAVAAELDRQESMKAHRAEDEKELARLQKERVALFEKLRLLPAEQIEFFQAEITAMQKREKEVKERVDNARGEAPTLDRSAMLTALTKGETVDWNHGNYW